MTSENLTQKAPKEPKRTYLNDEEKSDQDILDGLNKDMQAWYSYATDMMDRAYNILTFLYVDQWDQDVRNKRASRQKPTMTFDMCTAILRTILGEARRNSPENKAVGVGENPNNDGAEILTGMMRHISYKSNSATVYQTALKHMLEIGWGAVQVDICYEKGTFNKYLELIPCVDYQSCYWDSAAQEANRMDGDYCGNRWIMAKEDYDRMYPDNPNPVSVPNIFYRDQQDDQRDIVVGCNTWKKKYFNVTICKLSDGQVMPEKDAKALIEQREIEIADALARVAKLEKEIKKALKKGDEPMMVMEEMPEPLEIIEKRTEMDYDLIKYRWVNNYILEEEKWPGKRLPITYYEGDSVVLRGQRVPISFLQAAIDTQKLINYYGSEVALSVLNSRREKVIGTRTMFQGVESKWRNADNIDGFLTYTPDPMATGSGGKPEFINPQPFHPDLLAAMQATIVQLKQVLGRPDETQGQESNAIAGVAIGKRQQAANNSVNYYIDNWEKGIQETGKTVLELMREINKGEQSVSLREADGIMRREKINRATGSFQFNEQGEPMGEIIENDIQSGDYDIEVQVAGSYDQQQLEKVNTFKEFVGLLAQVAPQAPQSIIDLVPKMIGLENAVEVQKRLVATAPPQLQAIMEGRDPKEVPPPPPPPEAIAEQKKAEVSMEEIKLKRDELMSNREIKGAQIAVDRQKVANDRLQMIIDAQLHGIDTEAAIKKAHAEVISASIKANAEIDKAHINLGTEHMKRDTETIKHHTQRMGHIAKMQQETQAAKAKSKQPSKGE